MYLVTGGSGFIGSNIAHELVKRGEKVRIVDNFSTGRRRNISDFLDEVDLMEVDIRDLGDMRRAVRGVDFILHQAALPSVPRSINDPIESNETNVNGTLNLLIAAKDAGVKRLVYATSSSVYGDMPVLPKCEDMMPCPLSPYAVGKLTGEHYCKVFYNVHGLETVSLRYFNVFGSGQDPASQYSAAIPKFISAMLEGRPITIYGDGEQSRDFTHVQNVVNANLLACEAPDVAGAVINIACGEAASVNELISAIERELNIEAERIYQESRPGDVLHSCADITRAREMLGYEPTVSFGEGLKKTVEWFANNHKVSAVGTT